MTKKDLLLTPHNLDDNTWWYEENDGIHVVAYSECGCVRHVTIKWNSIRAALKRKDKPAVEEPAKPDA